MPPIDPNTLVVVLWGLTVVLLGWTWLPALISALGGSRYDNGGSEDTSEMEPAGADADYRHWYDQSRELGYAPLGPAWMRIRFEGSEWQFFSRVRTFYSNEKKVYFFVQQLPPPARVWIAAHLATPFADGGMLLTANTGDTPPDFEAESIRQGKAVGDLAELEILHMAALEVCRKRGRLPETDGSIATLLDAAARNWGTEVRRAAARSGWNYLLLHGLIHACASIPAAEVFGFAHVGVPVTNLGLWALLAISHTADRQTKAAVTRAAMEQWIARRRGGGGNFR